MVISLEDEVKNSNIIEIICTACFEYGRKFKLNFLIEIEILNLNLGKGIRIGSVGELTYREVKKMFSISSII